MHLPARPACPPMPPPCARPPAAGASNFGGTLAWAAPELLLGAPTTHKADIYSLGARRGPPRTGGPQRSGTAWGASGLQAGTRWPGHMPTCWRLRFAEQPP